jgi:hypothetical protein
MPGYIHYFGQTLSAPFTSDSVPIETPAQQKAAKVRARDGA